MKHRILLCLLLSLSTAFADLGKYSQLVKADPPSRTNGLPRSGVRITYLGTNAYLLECRGARLLVDPYFSRQSLFRTAASLEPIPNKDAVDRWIAAHRKIDAVLVTHGHIDHLFDAPAIIRGTGARLIASPTSVQLAKAAGVPAARARAVRPGSIVSIGRARIRVLPATHDRVFGVTPFDGAPKNLPPRKISDWVLGEPVAFLIEMGGERIFINSGGRPDKPLALPAGPVDLAIVGVASPEAVAAFPATIRQLRPRYILPSHQDNFFQPLENGFTFLPLTNFPEIRRTAAASSGQLILLDYFKPWTLH